MATYLPFGVQDFGESMKRRKIKQKVSNSVWQTYSVAGGINLLVFQLIDTTAVKFQRAKTYAL